MRINADQLAGQLRRGLASVYFISGGEPLLAQECGDLIRQAAHAAGFIEREVLTVEPGFDWNALYASTQSLSLFSERRLFDLRLPTGKPGELGAKTLTQIVGQLPPEVLLLISAGKLEKQSRQAKWVKALEDAGVSVTVYPIETEQFPRWVTRRMQAKGLKPGPGAAELLAYYMEGNLLACAQEIDKLAMLCGRTEIGLDDIEGNLSDNARFDVFSLADACLQGEAAVILRILRSLRAEGSEPVLILWALARELREIASMSAKVASGQAEAQVLGTHRVWQRRKPLVRKALKRSRPDEWHTLLQRAARTDRVIKGRLRGDVWHELQCLALGMGGFSLPAQRI